MTLRQFAQRLMRVFVAERPVATPEVAVPRCLWCAESLEEGARHPAMPQYHVECAVRTVSGSLAHVQQRCGCFVRGAIETDPPGLTRRQAAMAVYRHIRAAHVGPPN